MKIINPKTKKPQPTKLDLILGVFLGLAFIGPSVFIETQLMTMPDNAVVMTGKVISDRSIFPGIVRKVTILNDNRNKRFDAYYISLTGRLLRPGGYQNFQLQSGIISIERVKWSQMILVAIVFATGVSLWITVIIRWREMKNKSN